MPILMLILALFTPRLVIFLLWFFSTWFNGVFITRGWPILGFFFMPLTLLCYSLVKHMGAQWNWWQVGFIILAAALDLGIINLTRQ